MKKEVMSIKKQIFLSHVINGAAWIVAGIFSYFDTIPSSIIVIIALAVSTCTIVSVLKSEKEKEDEMSLQHITEAKAFTHDKMQHVMIIMVFILLFTTKEQFGLTINWKELLVPVFYVLNGTTYLLVGLKFKKLEEE